MIVVPLAAGYLAIGVVLAAWVSRRLPAGDCVVLALVWPIYGPILLERGPHDRRGGALDPATAARIDEAAGELAALDRVLARHAGADGAALAEARADQVRRREALAAIERLRAAIATQRELAPWIAGAGAERARLVEALEARLEQLERGNKPTHSGVE